jgi:hypothetical protein
MSEPRLTAKQALARFELDPEFRKHVNAIAHMRTKFKLHEIQAMVALAEGLHRAQIPVLVNAAGGRIN